MDSATAATFTPPGDGLSVGIGYRLERLPCLHENSSGSPLRLQSFHRGFGLSPPFTRLESDTRRSVERGNQVLTTRAGELHPFVTFPLLVSRHSVASIRHLHPHSVFGGPQALDVVE